MNWESVGKWMVSHGWNILTVAVVFIIFMFLVKWIGRVIERNLEEKARAKDSKEELYKRANTMTRIIRNLAIAVFLVITGFVVLSELGVSVGPLLAGAGIAGIAIGLGAQKLIGDYLNGFFIIIENQYRVGDVIKTAGVAGLVESVGFRTTILRDLEGRVHTIPNGEITVVSNLTKGFSRYVLDVGIAYKENVNEVIELLGEIGEGMRADDVFGLDILEPFEILGVQDFGDSAIVIRTRFTTKPMTQWDVAREYRRRIKIAFDERGIEIPFPHRTVYFGQPAGEEISKYASS